MVEITVELAIPKVSDEKRAGLRVVAPDDEMNRARAVFDRAHEIKFVLGRIELRQIGNHLKQSERQHYRAIGPLLVDHVDRDIAGRAHATKPNRPGIEAPVLRTRLGWEKTGH